MMHERMMEVNAMIKAKEVEVVHLYAKQTGISIVVANNMYHSSRLRKIIRDKKTELYLESPYFILERYSEYMEPIQIRTRMPHVQHSAPVNKDFLNKKVIR